MRRSILTVIAATAVTTVLIGSLAADIREYEYDGKGYTGNKRVTPSEGRIVILCRVGFKECVSSFCEECHKRPADYRTYTAIESTKHFATYFPRIEVQVG